MSDYYKNNTIHIYKIDPLYNLITKNINNTELSNYAIEVYNNITVIHDDDYYKTITKNKKYLKSIVDNHHPVINSHNTLFKGKKNTSIEYIYVVDENIITKIYNYRDGANKYWITFSIILEIALYMYAYNIYNRCKSKSTPKLSKLIYGKNNLDNVSNTFTFEHNDFFYTQVDRNMYNKLNHMVTIQQYQHINSSNIDKILDNIINLIGCRRPSISHIHGGSGDNKNVTHDSGDDDSDDESDNGKENNDNDITDNSSTMSSGDDSTMGSDDTGNGIVNDNNLTITEKLYKIVSSPSLMSTTTLTPTPTPTVVIAGPDNKLPPPIAKAVVIPPTTPTVVSTKETSLISDSNKKIATRNTPLKI